MEEDASTGIDGVDGRRSTVTSAGGTRTQPASNLTYQNRDISLQRHMGISTSSTTSRSTCKTNSSNYRCDLRDISTSTASRSSYESRHVIKSPYAYDDDTSAKKRRPSDSGGESEGRSLDLASSHTSDDDETNTTRSLSLNRNLKAEHRKPELPSKPSFMPNICEAGELQIPTPTPPHMMPMSDNIRPLYSPAWSSQLPPAYPVSISYNSPGRWVSERLSSTTASENEQTSPNLSYVIPSRLPLGMPRSYASYDANGHPIEHHANVEINYQRSSNLPSPPSDYRYSSTDNQMEVNADDMMEGVELVNDLNLSDLPENLVSEHILEAPIPYAMETDMADSDYV